MGGVVITPIWFLGPYKNVTANPSMRSCFNSYAVQIVPNIPFHANPFDKSILKTIKSLNYKLTIFSINSNGKLESLGLTIIIIISYCKLKLL